jgi:hypothetical protein
MVFHILITIFCGNNNNNNNSIRIYLRANLTAQKPVTKLARVRRTKQQNTNKIQNKTVYIVIAIIIIIITILKSIIIIIQFLTAQQPKDQC